MRAALIVAAAAILLLAGDAAAACGPACVGTCDETKTPNVCSSFDPTQLGAACGQTDVSGTDCLQQNCAALGPACVSCPDFQTCSQFDCVALGTACTECTGTECTATDCTRHDPTCTQCTPETCTGFPCNVFGAACELCDVNQCLTFNCANLNSLCTACDAQTCTECQPGYTASGTTCVAADGTVVDNGAAANNVVANDKSGCKLRKKCPLNGIAVPASKLPWYAYSWWKPQRYSQGSQQARTQQVPSQQSQQLMAQQEQAQRMQKTAAARGRRGRLGQRHG